MWGWHRKFKEEEEPIPERVGPEPRTAPPPLPDWSEAFIGQEQALEKQKEAKQAEIQAKLKKIKDEIRQDMLNDIAKANQDCKAELKDIYIRSGKFPTRFECVVFLSKSPYCFDDYNKVEKLPILLDVQKSSPNKITFSDGFDDEYGRIFVVNLNKIV